MDPFSAFLFAAIVATVYVSDWAKDVRDAIGGKGFPRHERRKQQRQHDHERRMARDAHRHAERMAGKAGPTIQESVSERIRRGPKTRGEMGPVRGWWWDLCDDTYRRLTDERRARYERNATGQSDSRRAWEWTQRQARAWRERTKDRSESGQPDRVHVDSERTDYQDPNAPDPGVEDAQVVDEPSPWRPRTFAELTEDSCRWGYAVAGPDGRLRVEVCRDHDQATAGAERSDDSWLPLGGTQETYPVVYEHPDLGWVLAGTGHSLPERTTPLMSENPPATVHAVAVRIPSLTGASPAEHASSHEGAPHTMAEIFNPESASADAQMLETEAGNLVAQLDQRIGELTAHNVTGEPVEAYIDMQEHAAGLAASAARAGVVFVNHQQIHDVVHSDDSIGNGAYLEVD